MNDEETDPKVKAFEERRAADDRRGLKHEWYGIEPAIRSEIKRVWRKIVKEAIDAAR